MKRMNKQTHLLALLLVVVAMVTSTTLLFAEPADDPEVMNYTRLLRRVQLTLTGMEPTIDDYEAMEAASDDAAKEALVQQAVDDALSSPAFSNVVFEWAQDLLKVGSYDFDGRGGKIDWAINIGTCGVGTLHEGRIGLLSQYNVGDGAGDGTCDNAGAEVTQVSPWWDPNNTVEVVGLAGNGVVTASDGYDCGEVRFIFGGVVNNHVECGCGPNMRFCSRPHPNDTTNNIATSIQRSVFEEPARLVEHIVMNDEPFSDVIAGDYTVVNQGLHFMYLRAGRQAGRNLGTDTSTWYQAHADDPHSYKRISLTDLSDTFTSSRTVVFDPRVDMGSPSAIPAAGVFTTYGMLGSNARERVRASRALETFACREFIPPPAELTFNPYLRDPGTEGACQHCHQLIDPAAIHFKRFAPNGKQIWGMPPWRWSGLNDFGRNLEAAFDIDTYMTPVTQAEVDANPDARFIDFLPPDKTLLGEVSDGTIGPLGFSKMLLSSGEFDRCMVRRFYEAFGGRPLTPGLDDELIDELAQGFISSNRNARTLIRTILAHDEFRRGI